MNTEIVQKSTTVDSQRLLAHNLGRAVPSSASSWSPFRRKKPEPEIVQPVTIGLMNTNKKQKEIHGSTGVIGCYASDQTHAPTTTPIDLGYQTTTGALGDTDTMTKNAMASESVLESSTTEQNLYDLGRVKYDEQVAVRMGELSDMPPSPERTLAIIRERERFRIETLLTNEAIQLDTKAESKPKHQTKRQTKHQPRGPAATPAAAAAPAAAAPASRRGPSSRARRGPSSRARGPSSRARSHCRVVTLVAHTRALQCCQTGPWLGLRRRSPPTETPHELELHRCREQEEEEDAQACAQTRSEHDSRRRRHRTSRCSREFARPWRRP